MPRLLEASRGARLTVVGRHNHSHAAHTLGAVSHSIVDEADGPVAVLPTLYRT